MKRIYKYIDGKVQEVKKDDGIKWAKLELGRRDLEYIKQMEEVLISTGQRRVKNECKRINL